MAYFVFISGKVCNNCACRKATGWQYVPWSLFLFLFLSTFAVGSRERCGWQRIESSMFYLIKITASLLGDASWEPSKDSDSISPSPGKPSSYFFHLCQQLRRLGEERIILFNVCLGSFSKRHSRFIVLMLAPWLWGLKGENETSGETTAWSLGRTLGHGWREDKIAHKDPPCCSSYSDLFPQRILSAPDLCPL